MRRATDKVEYKKLIEAGFKVKPDLMWNYTMRTDKPNPYLSDYCATFAKTIFGVDGLKPKTRKEVRYEP